MIKNIIHKSRYYINENKRQDARKLLYKYRYTKHNKKALIIYEMVILSGVCQVNHK